jgi:hypothetical protein
MQVEGIRNSVRCDADHEAGSWQDTEKQTKCHGEAKSLRRGDPNVIVFLKTAIASLRSQRRLKDLFSDR